MTGRPGLAQLPRDRLVAAARALRGRPRRRPGDRRRDRPLPLLDDQLVERILAGAVQPAGVEQLERRAPPEDRPRQRVAGRPGDGRDDARREPVMRLKRVDFPTFGRPTRTTDGCFTGIRQQVSLSLDSVSAQYL